MTFTRRSFLHASGAVIAAGSLSRVITSRAHAQASTFAGYGALVPDPDGIIDLPAGFSYRVFSREGDRLTGGGTVPGCHDGMAAFSAAFFGDFLVRNHEINPEDAEEDGVVTVAHVPGHDYDPEGAGGTSTLLVGRNRRLLTHKISLSGTLDNCAGGPTPWGTWLTCEENTDTLAKPHGYVFEVDPWHGGNPEPIKAMGRFEHEAVSSGRDGSAYLTEDTSEPFGLVYRFRPSRRFGGRGSLHAGGVLSALSIEGVSTDLSEIDRAGTILNVRWVDVPNVDPGDKDTPTREQGIARGATPIQKAEGTWRGRDGSIWFTASYANGPTPEEEGDEPTSKQHSGQIWRYDPRADKLELVAFFPVGTPWDGPDNITVGPHGFAMVCTDGDDENFLVAIGEDGQVFPFARNAGGDDEFTGATFSADGQTLYVNIQAVPAFTLAIRGPWRR